MSINKDDEKTVKSMVASYLSDNLWDDVERIVRYVDRDNRRFVDFLDDHIGITYFLAIAITFIVILSTIALFGFCATKIQIAKLNEEAKICVETGYGCKSDTKNTDIQYKDTPIVEINTKGDEK